MGFKIKQKLTGLEALIQSMSDLKQSIQSRALRPAVTKGARIISKEAKRLAPKESGLLRKSIGTKVKTYKSGVVVAIIGPRSKPSFRKTVTVNGRQQVRNPVNYAHLVEYGTVRTRPHSFLRAAIQTKQGEVRRVMAEALRESILKQRAKEAAKAAKRRANG